VEVGPSEVGPRGLVAATDVVADARRRDMTLVGDAAADRLRVARVMVGAEHAELGVARLHASLELVEAALVDVAEGLDLHRRSPFMVVGRARGRIRTAVSTRCRRAPRLSATVSCETLERIRTSARGVEARCSVQAELRGHGEGAAKRPLSGESPI